MENTREKYKKYVKNEKMAKNGSEATIGVGPTKRYFNLFVAIFCNFTDAKSFVARLRITGGDAYTRHKQLINNYVLYHKGSTQKFERDTSSDKNDYDIIHVSVLVLIK